MITVEIPTLPLSFKKKWNIYQPLTDKRSESPVVISLVVISRKFCLFYQLSYLTSIWLVAVAYFCPQQCKVFPSDYWREALVIAWLCGRGPAQRGYKLNKAAALSLYSL